MADDFESRFKAYKRNEAGCPALDSGFYTEFSKVFGVTAAGA